MNERDPKMPGMFALVLLFFLIVTSFLLSNSQQAMLRAEAQDRAGHDLDLMSDTAREVLLKSDYALVRTMVEKWGMSHNEFMEIRAIAPNGYVIAEYRSATPRSAEYTSLSRDVMLGDRKLATLLLVVDFHNMDEIATLLRYKLLLGAFILTALLGAAVWYFFQKLAMEPLEKLVAVRTASLVTKNQELIAENLRRQGADAALKQREEHTSLILNSISEGIYGVDLQGNITFINKAGYRILGYTRPGDLLCKNAHQLFHHTRPDGSTYASTDCNIYRCYRTGESCHVTDEVFWRPDNTSFPVEYRSAAIISDGTPVGAVTVFSDITAQKMAEDSIREANNRLQLHYTQTPLAMIEWDLDFKVILWNPRAEKIFGYTAAEAMGKHASFILTEAARTQVTAVWNALIQNIGGSHSRNENRRKDGTTIICEWHNTPLIDNNEKVIGVSSFVQDITEQQRVEDHLRHTQKMDSVGTLAGGIAHDFNNILTAIIGYGHIALMQMKPDDPQRRNLDHILASADRATYLTQGLLAFSRKQMSNKKQVNLNDQMHKTKSFISRIIGEDIEIITNLHPRPLLVLADPNQIDQILMNLATNARDAMPQGGVLTVTIACVQLDSEFTKQHGFGKEGHYARITIADTGLGISEEVKAKMFEPFFTTKEVGKGAGHGLSIIYGIVKQHDGYITVDSTPGKGTTFHLYLPLVEPARDEENTTGTMAYPERGTETILVAEDEEPLRKMMQAVFETFGYEVILAVDGEDAVQKFTAHKDRIHLFLSDMIMPKKNGKEAYEAIRQLRPDIKVIFASGYSPEHIRQKIQIEHGTAIVYKPISPRELLKTVRSVLDTGTVN